MKHRSFIEGAALSRQALWAGQVLAEALLCCPSPLDAAADEALGALPEEIVELLGAQPELCGARADLLTPGVRLDPILLAIAGRERRRLRRGLRLKADPALFGCTEHLSCLRERIRADLCGSGPARHADQIPHCKARFPAFAGNLSNGEPRSRTSRCGFGDPVLERFRPVNTGLYVRRDCSRDLTPAPRTCVRRLLGFD